jgi:hypothetical protein
MASSAMQYLSEFFNHRPNLKSYWPSKPNIGQYMGTDSDYCHQARWVILGVYKPLESFRDSGFANAYFKGQMISYTIRV